MPKNIFTLSVCALPVYAVLLYTLSAAWLRIFRMRNNRAARILPALVMPAITLHILPLAALLYIHWTLGLDTGDGAYTGIFLVTYGWVASLVIAGQAAAYYIPCWLIGRFPVKSGRLRDLVSPRTRALATVALVFIVALYTTFRTAYDASVVQTDYIPLPVLSKGNPVDSYTIAAIADLQFDEFTGEARADILLNKLLGHNPDLLLFAGDVLTLDVAFLPLARNTFDAVPAPDGTYAVPGDHDFWTDIDSVVHTLQRSGAYVGHNELRRLPVGADTLNLIMLTNCLPDELEHRTLDSLLRLPRRRGPTIALVHDARNYIVNACAEAGVDLLIGGHTHGSQIAIDFFGFNLTSLLMNSDYISGLYTQHGMKVYICNGLGMSVAPIRYNATPSFGVIRLVKKGSG